MTPSQYERLNTLLSEFSTITASFEQAEAEIKIVQLAAAKELLPNHATLKTKLADLEKSLRQLADDHYTELFPDDKRTHQTPFGGVKYQKSASLEVPDAEKSLLKIKLECQAEVARSSRASLPPLYTEDQLIRKTEELNLEALGQFGDATLALFGVTRKHTDNFTVLPFKMKSDKPRKAAPVKEAA